jgi:uncharacterized protein with von Willebrand factor type A (vWA) domain
MGIAGYDLGTRHADRCAFTAQPTPSSSESMRRGRRGLTGSQRLIMASSERERGVYVDHREGDKGSLVDSVQEW